MEGEQRIEIIQFIISLVPVVTFPFLELLLFRQRRNRRALHVQQTDEGIEEVELGILDLTECGNLGTELEWSFA